MCSIINMPWKRTIAVFLFVILASGCITQDKAPTTTSTVPAQKLLPGEVPYDDGNFEGALRFVNTGASWSVRFTPSTYPFHIKGLKYYIHAAPSAFEVHLMGDDGPWGLPGTDLIVPFNTTPTGVGWHTLDFVHTIKSGDFYVGLRQLNPNENWIGADGSEPIDDRTYFDVGKGWKTLVGAGLGYDIGIRVFGTTSATTTTTTIAQTPTTSTTTSSTTTTTIMIFKAPTLILSPGIRNCGGISSANITVRGDIVRFGGGVPASTPCTLITAMLDWDKNNLNVTIEKHAENKTCIWCNAMISFTGEIMGLGTGEYNLKIISEDYTLVEGTISPVVEVVEKGTQCLTQNDCPGEHYGPYVCIGDSPYRSHYWNSCINGTCVEKVSGERSTYLACKDIVALKPSGFKAIRPFMATFMRADDDISGKFVNNEEWPISDVSFGGDCRGTAKGPAGAGELFSVDLRCNPRLLGEPDEFDVLMTYTLILDEGTKIRADSGIIRGI